LNGTGLCTTGMLIRLKTASTYSFNSTGKVYLLARSIFLVSILEICSNVKISVSNNCSHCSIVADAIIYSPFKVIFEILIFLAFKKFVILVVYSGFAVSSATSSLFKYLPYLSDFGSET